MLSAMETHNNCVCFYRHSNIAHMDLSIIVIYLVSIAELHIIPKFDIRISNTRLQQKH